MKKMMLLALAAPHLAFAHPGHGATFVSHWHTSDAWGYLMVAAVLAAALWPGRRK